MIDELNIGHFVSYDDIFFKKTTSIVETVAPDASGFSNQSKGTSATPNSQGSEVLSPHSFEAIPDPSSISVETSQFDYEPYSSVSTGFIRSSREYRFPLKFSD